MMARALQEKNEKSGGDLLHGQKHENIGISSGFALMKTLN